MLSKNKYPYFDFLEVILENDFVSKPYKPLSPVKAGNIVPDFALSKDFGRWKQLVNGADTPGLINHRQLANQPLVIAFYSEHWGKHGLEQLKRLNALHHEVKALGGNLVVISPENQASLDKLAWEHNLTLNFYFDFDNQLSRQLRVYDEQSPVWNRFSGVDENVPLLATYVLNAEKQIIYDHVDWDFQHTFSDNDILAAVYEAGIYGSKLRSA